MGHVQAGRLFFSSKVRRQIEELSCRDPESVGWHLTHWSHRSLAQAAVKQEYVERISHVTIGTILREADLYPQGWRYWKTTVWDDAAVARALKILWYYERTESLWRQGEVLLALDEKPNIQVLERAAPKQLMRSGQIERQEFDYHRHGTVNLLAGLTVYNGRMQAACLDKNDGEHFRPVVKRWLHPYGWARRIHLVMDNGSSHISGDTTAFFHELAPRVQVLLTPVNASWLNQAEALLEGFSERYLKRGSWNSREQMIEHIADSATEYDRHFAHRFNWQWSCRAFRHWLNNTPGLIRCGT